MKIIAALLTICALVYVSFDFFSIESISGQLFGEPAGDLSEEASQALSQPYHYLGKGKQAYAFVSEDGKWVLKFFNQKYFKLPFWAFLLPGEKIKREKRRKFYELSYGIAAKTLKEETGIRYLHQGPSLSPLPHLLATDNLGRSHRIDLNGTPFVLQRKAAAFYPALKAMAPEEQDAHIDQFLFLIATRIDRKIGDKDHNVEDNFGVLEGKVIHLDPGRLYYEEALWDPEKLQYEWWSATHQFRKWLTKNAPGLVTTFDERIKTNLQRVLQRSQASPSPQKDESPPARSPAFLNN
jgi:hypothetical protein